MRWKERIVGVFVYVCVCAKICFFSMLSSVMFFFLFLLFFGFVGAPQNHEIGGR